MVKAVRQLLLARTRFREPFCDEGIELGLARQFLHEGLRIPLRQGVAPTPFVRVEGAEHAVVARLHKLADKDETGQPHPETESSRPLEHVRPVIPTELLDELVEVEYRSSTPSKSVCDVQEHAPAFRANDGRPAMTARPRTVAVVDRTQ